MKLTIVMDNGVKYAVSELITDKFSKTDIEKVLKGLGLFDSYDLGNINWKIIGLNDNKTDILIRQDKISNYEYTL